MVIGHRYMTEKTINIAALAKEKQIRLSIQCSLNGLSFFIIDTILNKVLLTDGEQFKTSKTPYLVLKSLQALLAKHGIDTLKGIETTVIHDNDMFCHVPNALFNEDELPNYLKFNGKLLANDEVVFDSVSNAELSTVYVPFTNINNFIFDLFGVFQFKHLSTELLETLAKHQKGHGTVCYAHFSERNFEIAVYQQKKLQLYNQFQYTTKEDVLYYLLFVYEQLQLDVEEVKLKLFGLVEEDDVIFDICYTYFRKVQVFEPKNLLFSSKPNGTGSIDLTLLS
ncbi:Hypothetical protein I595_3434 [Croceitalea dokdonensis DOKDO 023]|uniref:DUF3822 family protein n=2 Tax=Croceitalea TaxID=574891 RepID=A0A0P7AYA3_9FLAO|nr:Hypothetical protein I595_3434 [Croceitalea dokdonensis DOKDO 023]